VETKLYLWYSYFMRAAATRRRPDTRERILGAAQDAVLEKGFGATSIDELIAAVGITKSGFFYHFRDKSDLAKALLERYVDDENRILDELFRRAEELHDDPLHQFLIALKLLAELMEDLPNGHPGCMVASVCYQEQLFNRDVVELNATAVRGWRRRFRQKLDAIAEEYPPQIQVDLDALADMASGLVDGGIILSKVLRDHRLLPKQVLLYREFVRAIFQGTGQ
jgi:TetR/AcrR family transcriptional repressor of nem operon